jgi:hypothetical protein
MKRIIIGIILLLLYSSCREEHVAPINQLVKDLFCFKTGSEWVYYDSVSQTMQKMTVTDYETLNFGYPKPYGKTRDFAEYIKMDLTVEKITPSISVTGATRLKSYIDQDNTLRQELSSIFTPIGSLRIGCDENNNFTPSATYLNTCMVNEIIYSDVYVFNNVDSRIIDNVAFIDSFAYYVSKHTGFIKCVRKCSYDEFKNSELVLIDKNVQQ